MRVKTWAVPLAAALVCVSVIVNYRVASDWRHFDHGARLLFSARGLYLYADVPYLQIGPLAFVAAEPLRLIPFAGHIATALLLAPTLAAIARAARLGTRQLLMAAGLLLAPWAYLGVFAHLDDALALCLLAVGCADRRRVGWWFAAAVACKPVALFAAPLLLIGGLGAVLTAGAIVAVIAAPFVIAAPATLTAVHPTTVVFQNSLPGLFGASTPPSWLRLAQLGAAVGLCWVGRFRWWRALFLAAAARVMLDTQVMPYYIAWLVVGAIILDGIERRRPTVSLLAFAAFVASLEPQWGAWWLVPLAAAVVVAVRRDDVLDVPIPGTVKRCLTTTRGTAVVRGPTLGPLPAELGGQQPRRGV